jgi:hypothetical protein
MARTLVAPVVRGRLSRLEGDSLRGHRGRGVLAVNPGALNKKMTIELRSHDNSLSRLPYASNQRERVAAAGPFQAVGPGTAVVLRFVNRTGMSALSVNGRVNGLLGTGD